MEAKAGRSPVAWGGIAGGIAFESDPILRALVASSIGFAIFDRACRYQAINRTLAAPHCCSRKAHIGRPVRQFTGGMGDVIMASIERVFATGVPIVGDELSGKLPMRADVRHWSRDYLPILDDKGRVANVCMVVIDVTDHKRLAQRLSECRSRAIGRLTSMMKVSQSALYSCWRAAASGQPQRSDIERDLRAFRRLAEAYQEMLREIAGTLPFANNGQNEIRRERLPERQRTVIRLLAKGESIKEIASSLGIRARTVETHKARIFKRLGFKSLADLTRYAIKVGLVGL